MSTTDSCHIASIRKATSADIPEILKIMDSARAFQRSLGFVQWKDGYPSVEIIESDISQGGAMVFIIDGIIEAYAFLAFGDPAYDELPDNLWKFKGNYGVVHRLAVSDRHRGHGISSAIFRMIESEYRRENIGIVRVDTGEKNIVMRKIMARNGYSPLGLHNFIWGPRLVFEKRIIP